MAINKVNVCCYQTNMYSDQHFQYKQVSGLDLTDQEIFDLTKFVKCEIENNDIKRNLLKVLDVVLTFNEHLTAFQEANKVTITEVQDTITKFKNQTHSDKVKIRELEDENYSLKQECTKQNTIIVNLQHDVTYLKSQSNSKRPYSTPDGLSRDLRKPEQPHSYQQRLIETDYLAECD